MAMSTPPRGCRIHAVGVGPRPHPWRKPPRRLPFHLLVLTLDGSEVVECDDQREVIPPGGVYLITAGQRAAIGAPSGNRPVFVHCDLVLDGRAAERAAWNWFADPEGHGLGEVQPPPAVVLGAEIALRPPPAMERLLRRRLPVVVATWQRGDALAVAEAENALEGLFIAWARAVAVRPGLDDVAMRIARAEAVAVQHLDTPLRGRRLRRCRRPGAIAFPRGLPPPAR